MKRNLLRMRPKQNKFTRPTGGNPIVMTTPNKNLPPSAASAYPDKTTGSEAAAKVRKAGNQWTEEQRADLFKTGMQIIYGGTGTKGKVCPR